ncbi:unnamed protein product [Hydatigera taeniaeformis]|uniref:PGM_PMM_III domain-containing protein n=1 Tax=Hydatigena taeniaeformis TaxID=6205 RepID=A0A0R3X9V7_HYDTA|nr:unnamed protein product [Hydatigera taeniaeformis]
MHRVCKVKNIPVFETPTGWKFFGNLLDAEMASVCGEESFGTGSNHIREKDGIWSFLCWVSILASRQAEGKSANVRDVLRQHWSKYGRDFFTRYDYENCTEEQGKQVMERVKSLLSDPEFVGRTYTTNCGTCFKVLGIDDFSYTDPVDHSVSKNQGIRIMLNNETRIVYRMSGTGSSGSTIRIYVNTFSADPNTHDLPATLGAVVIDAWAFGNGLAFLKCILVQAEARDRMWLVKLRFRLLIKFAYHYQQCSARVILCGSIVFAIESIVAFMQHE